MNEKLASKELMLSPEGMVAPPPDPDDDVVVPLPQAAANAAAPRTPPHRAARLKLLDPIVDTSAPSGANNA
jgi:hypothetical protein